MVRKLLFGLMIFSAFMVNAQDFSLDTSGVNVVGTTLNIATEVDFSGETGTINLTFTNISSTSKTIVFKRHNVSQENLVTHEICDDHQCMEASSPTADHALAARTFAAGESLTYLIHARFEDATSGNTHELYTAYEEGNESNVVSVDVIYTIATTAVKELANGLIISSPYPNPSNENVNFNYNLNSNGYVTIHDVTGKQIGNLELVQGIEKATYNTSDLNNGIYFYNVYVEGIKTYTDKFIVRH